MLPPLPGNLAECVEPKQPTDAAYYSVALAFGDAITPVLRVQGEA